MTTPITRRYRFWITVGGACMVIGVVLMCSGHTASCGVASFAAGMSWVAALAMWDGPRARRQYEQWQRDRQDLNDRLRDHGRP